MPPLPQTASSQQMNRFISRLADYLVYSNLSLQFVGSSSLTCNARISHRLSQAYQLFVSAILLHSTRGG